MLFHLISHFHQHFPLKICLPHFLFQLHLLRSCYSGNMNDLLNNPSYLLDLWAPILPEAQTGHYYSNYFVPREKCFNLLFLLIPSSFHGSGTNYQPFYLNHRCLNTRMLPVVQTCFELGYCRLENLNKLVSVELGSDFEDQVERQECVATATQHILVLKLQEHQRWNMLDQLDQFVNFIIEFIHSNFKQCFTTNLSYFGITNKAKMVDQIVKRVWGHRLMKDCSFFKN